MRRAVQSLGGWPGWQQSRFDQPARGEGFNRPCQQRFTVQFDNLLWRLAAEAGAGATGRNDQGNTRDALTAAARTLR